MPAARRAIRLMDQYYSSKPVEIYAFIFDDVTSDKQF
jgi:hypothetical protein